VNGSEERAHSAGAGTSDGQTCRVEAHGAKRGCTGEEREEVYDVFEYVVSRAGREKSVVCRDECETRGGRAS
jgi:hypothetical protein